MTRAELATMAVLECYAGQDGLAWPSQSTIARLAGLTTRSVRRALVRLTAWQVLGIETRSTARSSTRYRLAPTALAGALRSARADTRVRSEGTPVSAEHTMEHTIPSSSSPVACSLPGRATAPSQVPAAPRDRDAFAILAFAAKRMAPSYGPPARAASEVAS